MKKIFLNIFFILFFLNNTQAQNNNTQAALYNVGLGSFFGGIGAVINKKPQEKTGKVFIKGFLQGSLGGYVTYLSKQSIYNFSNSGDFKDAWTSKILNSIGNSMVHNAAENLNFWEKAHINFAFNRLEIELTNNFKTNYKIMPLALYATIVSASRASLDFNNTLKTGQLIFKTNRIDTPFDKGRAIGIEHANNIIILDNLTTEVERNVLAHEIIHTYQYNEFANINPIFIKPKIHFLNNTNSLVKFYKKWFYTDVNQVLFSFLYNIKGVDTYNHYNNPFEKEADYYSSKHAH